MSKLHHFSPVYVTDQPARVILDKLEKKGFTVVGVSGAGQTCVWTMHRPSKEGSDSVCQIESESEDFFEGSVNVQAE